MPNRSKLGNAAHGARKYAAAKSRGDIASPEVQADRVQKCQRCVSRHAEAIVGRMVWSCGPMLQDRSGEAVPTCGCVVAVITREGEVVARGKTELASETCPQGRW